MKLMKNNGHRVINKRFKQRGVKGMMIIMILTLLFSGMIAEVYGKDHEYSSVTAISGGGDFEVGDRFQVRVSYTNSNGQNIAGMMARITFPRRILTYESTTLGPGSLDGFPEGYGTNLGNKDRINQNGVFTLGLYNRNTVPALGATITFVVIAEGEGEITSTIGAFERAGWVDDDGEPYFLSGSSGSVSFTVEKTEESGESDFPEPENETDTEDNDNAGDHQDTEDHEEDDENEEQEALVDRSTGDTDQDSATDEYDGEDELEGDAFRNFLQQADKTRGGNGNEEPTDENNPEDGADDSRREDRTKTGTYLIMSIVAVLIAVLFIVFYQKKKEKRKKAARRKI